MNRCPDCNKFVSLETGDPEEESSDVTSEGTVEVSMRVVRNCADCGTEMKEATIDATADVDSEWLEDHDPSSEGHGDFEVEIDGVESTESGGGRYAKNMIGFTATAHVTCKCGETTDVELSGEEAASFFDDLN